jgi:polar amino acid transport system substrate-binding protein
MGMRERGRCALAVLALVWQGCAEPYPRDPEGTAERVQESGVVRVGLTEHRPWVVRDAAGEPRGTEVDLVRRVAAQLEVRIAWQWGQQEALLAALERFELDLVAGGVHEKTPWSERVALTRPWHEQARVLALPPGENGWLMQVERLIARDRKARTQVPESLSP